MVEYGSKAFELILSEYTHIERVGCRVRGGSSLQAYFLDGKICVFLCPENANVSWQKLTQNPTFCIIHQCLICKTLRMSVVSTLVVPFLNQELQLVPWGTNCSFWVVPLLEFEIQLVPRGTNCNFRLFLGGPSFEI